MTSEHDPTSLPPAIAELAKLPQWLVWRAEKRDREGKPTKVPYCATSGFHASATDPQTWTSYQDAVAALETGRYSGIGFVFATGGAYVGVDLDACRDPKTGEIQSWARQMVEELSSYTEVSVSGEGLHVILRGTVPFDGRRCGKIEVYAAKRFFVVTGHHLPGTAATIEPQQGALAALVAKTWPGERAGPRDSKKRRIEIELGELCADLEPPSEKLQALLSSRVEARGSWEHTRDFKDQSCSVYEQSLANWAARDDWADHEIVALLISHRRRWEPESMAKVLRPDYLERTIQKAREAAQRSPDELRDGLPGDLGDLAADADGEADESPSDPASIARWMVEEEGQHFARDGGGKLYIYRDGIYVPNGERRIRSLVKRYFSVVARPVQWSSHKAQEVCHFIEADSAELWEVPPLDRIVVLNGILDLREFLQSGDAGKVMLLPHAPEHLSPIQIPILYDPAAQCPAWDRQVESTFPADAWELAWEIPAWLIVPCTSIQRAILLLGEGGTGKSTYLAAVKAFLGRRNVAAKTLHRLESNRFSVGGLFGKLANICADLPSTDLAGTAMFKALTGGDEITGEHKFLSEFSFQPFVRLIFSANRPPKSNDPSDAFFERWVVVPFERKFRGQEGEIPRQRLDAMLAEPGELSGVLNRALAALPRVLARGFTVSDTMRRAHEAFREVTDPVLVWIHANLVVQPSAIFSKAELLSAYNRAAATKGRPVETAKAFAQALYRWKPDLREGQRTWRGQSQVWCWLGIGLRGELPPDDRERSPKNGNGSLDSRDSRVPDQFINRATLSDDALSD